MKSWLVFIPAGLIALFSCHGPNNAVVKTTGRVPVLNSIDTFKVPEDIEGCGYYFSTNQPSFKTGDYLFVANQDSVGYISVDKKLIKLNLISSTRDPENFSDHVDIYTSNNYKVTVKINYTTKAEEEESWLAEGTITIEGKDGQKGVRKFFGERGC